MKEKHTLKFKKEKGKDIVVYTRGMTDAIALDIIQDRKNKLAEEMKTYEPFYKKFLRLSQNFHKLEGWESYIKCHPDELFKDESSKTE